MNNYKINIKTKGHLQIEVTKRAVSLFGQIISITI